MNRPPRKYAIAFSEVSAASFDFGQNTTPRKKTKKLHRASQISENIRSSKFKIISVKDNLDNNVLGVETADLEGLVNKLKTISALEFRIVADPESKFTKGLCAQAAIEVQPDYVYTSRSRNPIPEF